MDPLISAAVNQVGIGSSERAVEGVLMWLAVAGEADASRVMEPVSRSGVTPNMRVLATLVSSALIGLVACSGGPPKAGPSPSAATRVPAPGSPSLAAPAGSPIDVGSLRGRIVFSDETNDVWSMHADGTAVKRLTSSRALEFDPAWSPDATLIAYRHQTGDDSTTEIYIMRANGSGKRNLSTNRVPDWGPSWTPKGLISYNHGQGGFGFRLIVGHPDGSGFHLVGRHVVEYPAWSPNGRKVAFMAQEPGASGNNPDYNVYVMNADGSNVTRLTDAPGEDGWPAWSPDGTAIAFSSARDDCSISRATDCRTTGDVGPWADVWIMNADGSNQRRVTEDFGQFLGWSPDGREILVAAVPPCT